MIGGSGLSSTAGGPGHLPPRTAAGASPAEAARYDVLANLDAAGGRLRLGDLGASIVLSPSGLSKLLDRMQASDLIRREPDPDDARSTFAVITPRGRALIRKARRTHHELLQRRFGDALDDDDVADLTRIMERIAASSR